MISEDIGKHKNCEKKIATMGKTVVLYILKNYKCICVFKFELILLSVPYSEVINIELCDWICTLFGKKDNFSFLPGFCSYSYAIEHC